MLMIFSPDYARAKRRREQLQSRYRFATYFVRSRSFVIVLSSLSLAYTSIAYHLLLLLTCISFSAPYRQSFRHFYTLLLSYSRYSLHALLYDL